MADRKVKLKDQLGRVVRLDDGNAGATLGKNLYGPDGKLLTAAQIINPPASQQNAAPTLWKLVREIPANIQKLAALIGKGFAIRRDDGEWALRTLQEGTGIDIANPDGEAGNPTIGLEDLPNSGTGTLLAITRDAKGRVTGTKSATITGTSNQINIANGDAVAGLPTLSLAPAVIASLGKADSAVQSIVPGTGVTVNNADPRNPVVSASRQAGTFASRPAATSVPAGTIYFSTDAREEYISNGAAWVLLPSGGNELGYAERTSDYSVAAGTTIDVPSLSVTSVVGMGDISVNFGGTLVMNMIAAGEYANLILYVDGVYTSQLLARAVGDYIVVSRNCRLSGFTPGSSHTFKIGLQSVGSAAATLAGTAADRPYIQVVTL